MGKEREKKTEINESKCKSKTSGLNRSKDDHHRAGEDLCSFLEEKEKRRNQVTKPGEPEWGTMGDNKQWNMTQVKSIYTRACECFHLGAGQQQTLLVPETLLVCGHSFHSRGWDPEEEQKTVRGAAGCCSSHRTPRTTSDQYLVSGWHFDLKVG